MRIILNILWFIFGGFVSGLLWLLAGLLCCITIIGIPFGMQCFKFASLCFFPFGKDVEYRGGTVSLLVNLLWLPIGVLMCVHEIVVGCLWCITIIGIPNGLQFFKFAKLSLAPFGARVIRKRLL